VDNLSVRAGRHWARPAGVVSTPAYWVRSLVLAGTYVGAAKLGIGLSVANGVITPVWAPSGIALAFLLLFGRDLWPAVAVGACIANATSGADVPVAALIAIGNTLEAVVAVTLLRRAGFRAELERVRDVLRLVVLGAGASALIAATNGVSVLSLTGNGHGSFGTQWLLWWFGDAVGILMVAPLLLVVYAHRRDRPSPGLQLEAVLVLAALAGTAAVVFLVSGAWRYPYVLFPLLLWAVLRFRQLGAAVAAFVVGAFATIGTAAGNIPIADASATTRVQLIQALVGLLAISLLVLGATLAEREAAMSELRRVAARLSQAQALTHIGSWEWDIAVDRVTWSEELYRIYGIPRGTPVTYGVFLEHVHPDDRAVVDEAVRRAAADHEPFQFEHRIVVPDGRRRVIDARGEVVVDDSGKPVRMVGTGQDITDRRQAERLRDDILSSVSHELRTPLTVVLGFAGVLKSRLRELDEQSTNRALDHIVGQARRLEQLLSDLLEVDRLEHGLEVATRRPVELAELVEHVAARHRNSERVVTVSASRVTANVDGPKVERIIDNLLANAVKHTPRGALVALRVERREDDVLIAVDDDGPGVPDEFKTAVFDPFERGTKRLSPELGAGVGLSLVARFAELHGGRAWVEDNDGSGASFRVLLPNCVCPEPIAVVDSRTG